MLRESAEAGRLAIPASQGRLSRSGQRAVPSAVNFQPDGLVESATGLNTLNARTRPSKLGSAKPPVTIMLDRCDTGWPVAAPVVAEMSVFGSGEPFTSLALIRFTVPTTGLT